MRNTWNRYLIVIAILLLSGCGGTDRLTNTPPATIKVGEAYTYTPEFSLTAEEEALFTISNQPEWILFDPDTGTISGTPSNTDTGFYPDIEIQTVVELTILTTQPFSITVEEKGLSPQYTLLNTPPALVKENETYTYTPEFSPIEGEIVFTITNKPEWILFDTDTGKISGTPADIDIGTYSDITIQADTGNTTLTTEPFSITVEAINPQPQTSQVVDIPPTTDEPPTNSEPPTETPVNKPPTSEKPIPANKPPTSEKPTNIEPPAKAPENNPPTFTTVPKDTTIFIGDTYVFESKASDPDKDDSLTFSISGAPKGITVNPEIGKISGKPTVAGTYAMTLSVSDGKLKASTSFSITVNKKNSPPTFIKVPEDTTIFIGDTYAFEPKASDPDKDDSLTFSISGAPKGITVNPEIGKISGKPTVAGTYAMTLSVSDGKLKASTSFSITVNKKNSPPTFIKVPEDTTIFIGDTYAFEPKASDPDKDDSLTFSISGAPKGITVNPEIGTISGKPTDAGTYKVTLSVSDNSKLTASTPFSIMVNKKNLPPTIGGTPSKTTFYATRKYTFKPTTNDPEKDKLTFSIEGAPDWLNFNENTGEISAQPTINDISPTRYEVTISVSDNAGNKRSLKPFTLSVQAGIKTATISWTAPTKNADGSELNDLDGYRIYYGPTKARQYENKTEQFGIGIDSYMIENLQLPEYFFSMTAIDTLGNESEYSKSVNKQVD